MADMPLYPLKTISKLLNLTDRRVNQLVKEGVIPREARGKYNLIECVRAYIKYLQDRSIGAAITPTDLQGEKLRLTAAQADEKELQVSQLRGELILAEDVEAVWSDLIASMRAKLLGLPTRLASKAVAANSLREVEDFTRTEIYAALNELSYEENLSGSEAGQGETPPAASLNS